jgi:hypothetical protein
MRSDKHINLIFRALPEGMLTAVDGLSYTQLEELFDQLLDMKDLSALQAWLSENR